MPPSLKESKFYFRYRTSSEKKFVNDDGFSEKQGLAPIKGFLNTPLCHSMLKNHLVDGFSPQGYVINDNDNVILVQFQVRLFCLRAIFIRF